MGDRNKQQRRSPCLIPTDYVYDNSGKKANYQLQCSGLPRYSDGYFHAKLWYKVDGIHFFISFRGSSMEEINHKATLFIPVLHAKIYNYVLSASSENVSGPNLYVFWSTYKDVLARNENWDESHRALAEYVMSTISSDKQIMCKSMAIPVRVDRQKTLFIARKREISRRYGDTNIDAYHAAINQKLKLAA